MEVKSSDGEGVSAAALHPSVAGPPVLAEAVELDKAALSKELGLEASGSDEEGPPSLVGSEDTSAEAGGDLANSLELDDLDGDLRGVGE